MATRAIWDASDVNLSPRSGITRPAIGEVLGRLVLAFDAAADEACDLQMVVPQGWTGTGTLVVYGFMASATSGTVGLRAAVEAITPSDALDLDTTRSFDTINYATSATVPGTAGYMFSTSITLTNADSLAAGDMLAIEFGRDADGTGTTDSATGDFYVSFIELRDTA